MSTSKPLINKVADWSALDVVTNYHNEVEPLNSGCALPLLEQSGILSQEKELVVIDNACGTGGLSSALYQNLSAEQQDRLQLICGDSAEGMVEFVKRRINDNGWKGAEARVILVQVKEIRSQGGKVC